jgi:hypothetical protein
MTIRQRIPKKPSRPTEAASLSLLSQTALVHALLDEVERAARTGNASIAGDQLVEELARLGCRCLDVAGDLSEALEAAPESDDAPPASALARTA